MSLNVLAKVQAQQYGAALESSNGADEKRKIARSAQLRSIEEIKNNKVGATDQKEIQEKKGFWGMVGGLAAGVGVVVACVAIAAATAATFGAAAVVVAGAVVAAGALTAAGRKIGHDVWGKVNAVKAEVMEKAAGFEAIDLTRAKDQAKEAEETAEDAAATADNAERFAKQIRAGMSSDELDEQEAQS